MSPYLKFLLITAGIVLLSVIVEKTTFPQPIKTGFWSFALVIALLFALYTGVVILRRLGLHA